MYVKINSISITVKNDFVTNAIIEDLETLVKICHTTETKHVSGTEFMEQILKELKIVARKDIKSEILIDSNLT